MKSFNLSRLSIEIFLSLVIFSMLMVDNAVKYFRPSHLLVGGLFVFASTWLLGLICQSSENEIFRKAIRHAVPSAIIIIIISALDIWSHRGYGGISIGLLKAGPKLQLCGMIPIFLFFRNSRYHVDIFRVIVGGLGIYCLINFLAYSAGIRGYHGLQTEFIQAAGESIGERMIAPFGPGLNNFGILAVLLVGLSIPGFLISIKAKSYLESLMMLLCIIIGIACIWHVQIRSALILFVIVLPYLIFPIFQKSRWTTLSGFLLPLAFPFLIVFGEITGLPHLLDFLGQFVVQRSIGDLATIGGRASIWHYALFDYMNGWDWIRGVGYGSRDLALAVYYSKGVLPKFPLTSHNGGLDILVIYGMPIFLLFVFYTYKIANLFSIVMKRSKALIFRKDFYLLLCAFAACTTEAFSKTAIFSFIFLLSLSFYNEHQISTNKQQLR